MRIVERIDILRCGSFPDSEDWRRACNHVDEAVSVTDWPHGTGAFTIYPESGKKTGQGNGVVPIKVPCVNRLRLLGWQTEHLPPVFEGGVLRPGDLDALYPLENGYIAFEWETGNISSSHRAMNKLLLTLNLGGIKGGFLVVPSDRLKVYLTDRIGNIGELRPYFRLWQSLYAQEAALRIVVVEHDAESFDVEKIPKGTDGRAMR